MSGLKRGEHGFIEPISRSAVAKVDDWVPDRLAILADHWSVVAIAPLMRRQSDPRPPLRSPHHLA
jgi:hypothetical protein